MIKLISMLTLWFTALGIPTAELNQAEQKPTATPKIQVAL